ncbi:hypothetical protein [Streptomyces sp. XD-27]|uniref:hypothetical protein n=1 Tax=Streptomyces sp. XD-27 TaxID=3062779 RepID=UPI0026F41184|nr:hypothetical protein [Streptomyces sp. XD-27]WKX72385.1 hypothetical protein Q3Y56_22970 [Streptomyces sp. XD-27]
MSVTDDLTAAQRCLDDLDRAIVRLEQQVGGGLDIKRIRSDSHHLRESLALLRESAPAEKPRRELLTIPDTPYDSALWADADDEGLGARDRRAP